MQGVQKPAEDLKNNVSDNRVRQSKAKKSKIPIILSVLFVLLVALLSAYFVFKSKPSPINKYVDRVSYSLYYPSTLPSGYAYKQGSAKLDSNILIYTLVSGNNNISISQQSAPKQEQSFKIDGFNSISTPNGTLLLGINNGTPVGILTTSKTLITIKADQTVSKETVSALSQSLKEVTN